MKTAYYDSKPLAFEAIGNGSFAYRWGMEEVTVDNHSIGDEKNAETTTKWKCCEVIVWGTVTSNKLTETVINAMWGNGVEEKMLNDYNAAQLGILDESHIASYSAFLTERKAIKDQIDLDCTTFNIPK